jgi:hypothetical protein
LIERVRELRKRGRTPKEIARVLGLSPAAVVPLIRAVAAAQPKREAPLAGCWVNQGWAAGLTVAGQGQAIIPDQRRSPRVKSAGSILTVKGRSAVNALDVVAARA